MNAHSRPSSCLGFGLSLLVIASGWASTAHASAAQPAAVSQAEEMEADDSSADELAAQSTKVSWAGVFVGTLESAGAPVPATTELREIDGTVSGRYSFEDKSGRTEGTLAKCVRLGARAIRCTWQDSYGVGDLELKLSADGTMIAGRWRAANARVWFAWNGTR
jgi:hypothetical protein